MDTKSTHTQHRAQRRYAPGSSRGTRSATTLLAQVADIERGQRIRGRREELHLTQPAVVDLLEEAAAELPPTHELHPAKAGKAPVTLRGYQTYEQGGGIVWEKAKLLAQVLQIDVQTMMSGEPERTVINGKVVQDASVTPSPFPERTIEGALAGILAQIQAQLAEQTEVLNEIRQLLTSDQQVTTETQEATRRLLGAVDVATRELRGDAPRTARGRAPRAK
jgi:hypothetical protein